VLHASVPLPSLSCKKILGSLTAIHRARRCLTTTGTFDPKTDAGTSPDHSWLSASGLHHGDYGTPCWAPPRGQPLWIVAKTVHAMSPSSCILARFGICSAYDPSAGGCNTHSLGDDDESLSCPAQKKKESKGTVHFVVYRLHTTPCDASQPWSSSATASAAGEAFAPTQAELSCSTASSW
jgi:hypothetical protein